ncbi:DUF2975 domain-containing protein [Flavobacterium caeni]|uniref:DUF2975 domain-containing protein n=1 Tax=Flavobacterium caeni TaxID=490189 RepID=A0A1G5IRZ1_9FLAO|nr:DUF2975 domain-containing protein [Flavobacterium caeni]SCY78856.1 Protein of unknown function [Flavobacterium caeni]
MKITIESKHILLVLHIISWILFIGLCIEACGFLVGIVLTFYIPLEATYMHHQVDLSGLYQFDRGYFYVQTGFISGVAIMRALLFYLIVRILYDRKVNLDQPFSPDMARFISKVGYLSLFIALFSGWGAQYSAGFAGLGVPMPDLELQRLGGSDVWAFMGVTLLVIAQLFKRGIEMQAENELTI